MRFGLIAVICLFLSCSQTFGQVRSINFEALDSLQKQAPRPVIVFLHAEWCKFCNTMKNTTFQDERIGNLLHSNFYFVSFDGESEEDVKFLGHTFRYKPTGRKTGIHELAEQLGTKNGTVTYPTIAFLNKQFEILYQHDGFLSARDLETMLNKVLEVN